MNHTVEMWSKINVVKNKHKYYAILIQSLCLLQIIAVMATCTITSAKKILSMIFFS